MQRTLSAIAISLLLASCTLFQSKEQPLPPKQIEALDKRKQDHAECSKDIRYEECMHSKGYIVNPKP